MRKKAISYIRFSTSEQALGDSYRRQYDATVKYCQENNLELDESFYDEGISAFKGSQKTKGKFGLILSNIEAGTIAKGTTLIVESIDRMSRETVLKQMSTFIQIIEKGITIVTLLDRVIHNEETIEKNPSSLMMTLGAMHRANEESETKSKRLSAAWDNKRKNMSPDNLLTSIRPSWLEINDQGQMEVMPDRAKVVREIYELSLSGCGRRSIAKTLNQRNEPIWSNKKRNKSGLWTDSYVQKILTNPAVIGFYQPHKKVNGKRIPEGKPISYFPAIIDETLFRAAQNKKKKRKHKGGRSVDKGSNLFTHIARCGSCGAILEYKNRGKGSKGSIALVCQNKRNGVRCNAKNIKYSALEEFILQSVMAQSWGELDGNGELQKLKVELESKENEKTTKQTKADNLVDAIGDTGNSPTLTSKLKKTESEIEETQQSIADIKGKIASLELSTASTSKARWNAMIMSKSKDLSKRRKLKSLVAEKVNQIFVQNIGGCISLIVLLNNNKILIGKLGEKNIRPRGMTKEQSIFVIEPWQMSASNRRYALSYELVWSHLKFAGGDWSLRKAKELKKGGNTIEIKKDGVTIEVKKGGNTVVTVRRASFYYKPILITFKKGINPITELVSESAGKAVSAYAPSPSKTEGIRALNAQTKEKFTQELDDYESLTPVEIKQNGSSVMGKWGKSNKFRDIASAQERALRSNLNS